MASEPAEPTTRQQPRTRDAVLARVIEAANEQVDDDWTTAGTLAFREYFGERLATRLADLGLLADPAQTTELERLRERVTLNQQLNADSQRVARKARAQRDALSLLLRGMARKLVAYRKWTLGDDVPEVHRLRRELAEARARKQADLDELKRALGLTRNTLKQNVEWRDRFRAERDEDRAELGETRRERDLLLWLHAEAAWRVAGFDVLTVALARRNQKLTAERNERQTRIDAANVIATRAIDEGLPADEALRLIARTLEGKTARALAGDQPTTEGLKRQPLRRTHALPRLAEGATRELGIALPGEEEYEEVADVSFRREEDWREVDAKIIRNAEEADDASEETQ